MKKIMIKNWQEVVIVLLVLVMPISTILMSRLQVGSGGVVSAEQSVAVATQEDFERLADEYSRYFEVGEDGSIDIDLDKDIRGEVEVIKEQAYREYMDRGIVLYDGSGLDYADYEVWQETEVMIEGLPEVSEQDKVLLEQYREFLNNFNSMLREGIFVAVVDDGVIRYEMAEQGERQGGVGREQLQSRATSASFDMTYTVISIPYPAGMKWFCQIIWGYYDVWIPSGYEMVLPWVAAGIVGVIIWGFARLTSDVFSKPAAFMMELTSFIGPLASKLLQLNITVDDLLAMIIGIVLVGTAISVAIAAFTLGVGTILDAIVRVMIGLLANYLLNRVGAPLVVNAGFAYDRSHSYVKMQSDLIFWGNDFYTFN
jgi:hypothetical protein